MILALLDDLVAVLEADLLERVDHLVPLVLDSGSSSCTFSRKVSYIDAFFVFASSTIMRNDTRSSDHSTTSVRAWIVAVRGQLYISASSPKESPTPNDLTRSARRRRRNS